MGVDEHVALVPVCQVGEWCAAKERLGGALTVMGCDNQGWSGSETIGTIREHANASGVGAEVGHLLELVLCCEDIDHSYDCGTEDA